MAGPQRGTAARGKRQGVLDRAEKRYGKSGIYDPSKINQFRGRGLYDYEELISDKDRALSNPRRAMSEKDRDLAVRSELADAGMRLEKMREEDPKMYLALKQGDMDRAMRRGAARFQGSSEDDSPGYSKGGGVKKMKKGGSVSSASKRADGCATKGKTRGKFV